MDNLRGTIESDTPELLRDDVFAFGYEYESYENYKLIGKEFFTNISLSLMMIFIIVTLLLVNPVASFITFFSIAAVIINEVIKSYFKLIMKFKRLAICIGGTILLTMSQQLVSL